MPRFTNMLADGMKKRGHKTEILSASPVFFNIPSPASIRKWLGYIDQFILFPIAFRLRRKQISNNSLFVLTDHALGPWAPLIVNHAHVIHCHDFLAQASAVGTIPQNPTSWTGKVYQSFIRKGYSKGKNFISVSEKTRSDLHQFLGYSPKFSEVVYNGLNQSFEVHDPIHSRITLKARINVDISQGYILHVGGNQWYKNRVGVIRIYDAWRTHSKQWIPLLLVGGEPDESVTREAQQSIYYTDIHFISNLEDHFIGLAYSGATLMLFPSLAEGFGWPIAEAMASGCIVITTNERPMTEVGGDAAFLIPKMPTNELDSKQWALNAGQVVDKVVNLTVQDRQASVTNGLKNAKRFDTDIALDTIECLYKKLLHS